MVHTGSHLQVGTVVGVAHVLALSVLVVLMSNFGRTRLMLWVALLNGQQICLLLHGPDGAKAWLTSQIVKWDEHQYFEAILYFPG